MTPNVFVYELWRISAQTFPDKNRLWKIRRIFQVWTDQAIAYIRCYLAFLFRLNSVCISFSSSPKSYFSVLDVIERGVSYIFIFAFISLDCSPFLAFPIYFSGFAMSISKNFVDITCFVLISEISFHSISPILEAFELSVIPSESIISP